MYKRQDVYKSYDNVVIVSDDIRQSTLRISGREDNIHVIKNCHDYESVIKRSELPVSFDKKTLSTKSVEDLVNILDSKSVKFINVGRYSPEKGHERLIKAFERYWKQQKDSYLIIIGGTGDLYGKTLELARATAAFEHIILIKSLSKMCIRDRYKAEREKCNSYFNQINGPCSNKICEYVLSSKKNKL